MTQDELTKVYNDRILAAIEMLKKNTPGNTKISIVKPSSSNEYWKYYSIEKPDCNAIGSALAKNNTATVLDLSNNSLGDKQMNPIYRALKKNTSLRTLRFNGNDVGVFSFKKLADCLKKNDSLQHIYCARNDNGCVQLTPLIEVLQTNYSIITIDAGSDSYNKKVKKLLQRNNNFYEELQSIDKLITTAETELTNLHISYDMQTLSSQIEILSKLSQKIFHDYAGIKHCLLFELQDRLKVCEFKYACLAQDWGIADQLLVEFFSNEGKYNPPESLLHYVDSLNAIESVDQNIMPYVSLSLLSTPINIQNDALERLTLRLHNSLMGINQSKAFSIEELRSKHPEKFTRIHEMIQMSLDLPLSWKARFRYFKDRIHQEALENTLNQQSKQIEQLTELVIKQSQQIALLTQSLSAQNPQQEVSQHDGKNSQGSQFFNRQS